MPTPQKSKLMMRVENYILLCHFEWPCMSNVLRLSESEYGRQWRPVIQAWKSVHQFSGGRLFTLTWHLSQTIYREKVMHVLHMNIKIIYLITGVWQWKVFTRNFPFGGSCIDIRPHSLQTPREAWPSENLKGWCLCRKKVGNKSPGNVKVFSTPRSTWPMLGKFLNVISSKNRQNFLFASIMSQFKISQFPSQERNADKECNNCQVAGAGFHELRQSITGAASVHKLLPSTKEAWNLRK